MSPLFLYLLLITFISSLAAQSSLYPFGSGAGDAQVSVYGSAGYIFPSTPILYFGQTISWIFIETDGVLVVGTNPGVGSVIATLQIDPSELVSGFYYYQQYTSGSVLSRATHDINQYFPHISFSASSVFVVTWDYVQTDTQQVIQFQAVLSSDGVSSFLLLNYGDIAATSYSVEAGFDTVGSTNYFLIPESNNGTNLPNLQFTSNVNVPGRWAFSLNGTLVPTPINTTPASTTTTSTSTPASTTTTTTNATSATNGPSTPASTTITTLASTTNATSATASAANTTTTPTDKQTTATALPTPVSSTVAAPGTFYQFGPSAGDAQLFVFNHDYSDYIYLSSPFFYFGRAYHFLLLYSNGLLSFTQPLPDWNPSPIPTGWNQDLIAPLWMNRSELKAGYQYYQQYTSGSVLSRATHDINQYFPHISFSASSVFVVTWDYVQTLNYTVFLQHAAPTIQFQAVLISDGFYSFVLMNYGNCAASNYTTEAGFDTVGSTNYFLIPGSNNGTNLPNLQFTSNVNVPGRWAFSLTDVSKVNLLGVQLTASSFVDLTQTGNAETLLQSIKQELMSYGMTDFELNIRNITRIKP